ncbi:hypothetical protein EQW78_06980 [Oerskovia turbata]|uniref:Uncharacterized protein n=1 Tax=Oerskovia turbata TaxID=1713 RepID=A0A4Q1KX78_9CELL|nr:hypothetical protein [Oerskovia turbata]RXR24855.1 hypothetical protein EQW73_13600 [Oerskovia turbata]RXR34941.1 hypothetical protein EQW78_06980 [Oerskovia turbata]TGJ96997.1 hypothetical protein DLJ96_02875 [Actinotalea fermentans ATCC 43279 = JCM 9966 = DSM 3133]
MWFIVWSVLVVGTLVGAFFLGRDLWRKARALLSQMSESALVMDRFAQRTDEVTAALAASQASTAPTLFDDPVLLHERVEELRAQRAERRAQRRTRNQVTWDRWRRFNA